MREIPIEFFDIAFIVIIAILAVGAFLIVKHKL